MDPQKIGEKNVKNTTKCTNYSPLLTNNIINFQDKLDKNLFKIKGMIFFDTNYLENVKCLTLFSFSPSPTTVL